MFTISRWAPFFKAEDKPKSPSDIFKLEMDQKIENSIKKEPTKSVSPEELEKIRQRLANM